MIVSILLLSENETKTEVCGSTREELKHDPPFLIEVLAPYPKSAVTFSNFFKDIIYAIYQERNTFTVSKTSKWSTKTQQRFSLLDLDKSKNTPFITLKSLDTNGYN